MGPSRQEGSAADQIIDLKPGSEANAWKLEITDQVAGATGTLHGGCGLAAAADALEKTTGRRLSFLSGQFLARAPVGSEVDIEVTELAVGNRVTQAAVTCRDGEIIVFRAAAALGVTISTLIGSGRQCPRCLPRSVIVAAPRRRVGDRLTTLPISA